MAEYSIPLPWVNPPLSLNDRMNRYARARVTREVRGDAQLLAKSYRVERGAGHVVVELHYQPCTRRRRDTDNLVATLKPICDGLVDAGVVADDTPDLMTKREPVIHTADTSRSVGRLWLVVTTSEAAS